MGPRAGAGVGPFDIRAAWEETRSFFYLGGMYVLVCNLIKTREQLRTFTGFIAAIGLKSIQGIVRYIDVSANGLKVDAITGHEDVVFFSAFVLLITGLLLFGAKRDAATWRQMRIMLVVVLPLVFTLLVTNRRLGFVVLGVGLVLVAVLLFRTRRDLFLRLAPVVLVTLGIYVGLFWNGTGTLSEPIRAVRSLLPRRQSATFHRTPGGTWKTRTLITTCVQRPSQAWGSAGRIRSSSRNHRSMRQGLPTGATLPTMPYTGSG